MTKTDTVEMLYHYLVNRRNLPSLAKQFPGESKATLAALVKHCGFNRGGGLFAKHDCGAYSHLNPPKFSVAEMQEHIEAYIAEDETRPDMDFTTFLHYRGINAKNAKRDIPKPMPQRVWHTSQTAAAKQTIEKEKKAPLEKSTAVGVAVLVLFVIVALGVVVFLFTQRSDDTIPTDTPAVLHVLG